MPQTWKTRARAWAALSDQLLRTGRAHADPPPADRPAPWPRAGVVLLAGSVYGSFMGWYALRGLDLDGLLQVIASSLKFPLLLLGTTAVTLPSLYVFSALAGSRLGLRELSAAMLGFMAVVALVAASLGPVLGFFTISTTSYAFMVLLNVAIVAVAALAAWGTLIARIRAVTGPAPVIPDAYKPAEPVADPTAEHPGPTTQPRARTADAASMIVWIWTPLFALVGLQMAWILRPFIGAPGAGFSLLRHTEGNALEAILGSIGRLLGING